MDRIEKNKNFLQLLCTSNSNLQKALIKNASKDQIFSICEIILNLLNGNLKIREDDLQKLSKKKKLLRELIKKGSSIKKKKFLIQRGGFLQFLIPALITGLASVVSSVIEKI